MVKLTDKCFCCFTAAMLVPLGRAPTWRFHTELYKFVWSTFPNNARMKTRTELNLGKVFYVWLIYHIQDSWLNSLNGYDIYFWLRDTANQPYGFGDAVSKLETFVWILNHISKSITWSLLTLKASYLVKWPMLRWSFMRWCQFIDWLKFETRPSPLLNFGMANTSYKIWNHDPSWHLVLITDS